MAVTFLHSADWQLGKPFGSVPDPDKRSRLQRERLHAVERIAGLAGEREAAFVLVAGDLFDSPTPPRGLVSEAFQRIGRIPAPVIAIPGNHDFGGPGGPWSQEFVRGEMAALAPNFRILLDPEPVVLEQTVLLPAPLRHRHTTEDPTAWIARDGGSLPTGLPRVVLAHGSVHGFSSTGDEEAAGQPNPIELERLPDAEIDYIALGDWHGVKQVGPKAWYAGTPEIDRFPKGQQNQPGHVLVVEAERGAAPRVETVATGGVRWERIACRLDAGSPTELLEARFAEALGHGADGALLELELSGELTIADSLRLRELLDTWESRLIRLKLRDELREAPSEEELRELTGRAGDPLVARVASRLLAESHGDDEDAAIARLALRELYQATHR